MRLLALALGIAVSVAIHGVSDGPSLVASRTTTSQSCPASMTSTHPQLLHSESPDRRLRLLMERDDQGRIRALRLVSADNKSKKATFPLSDNAKTRQDELPCLWSEDSRAVAVQIGDERNAEVYVCTELEDGSLRAINLTPFVEAANIGKLGRPESDFLRREHTPLEWWAPSESGRILEMRSRFWDRSGKRYTVSEPVLITKKGEGTVR